jgi:beta-glucosidase
VTVDVRNVGASAGDEVVQIYVHHEKSDIPTPIHQLVGFERVHLDPGELKTVRLHISPYWLSSATEDGNRVIEPGQLNISVGGIQPGYEHKAITTGIISGSFSITGNLVI